MDDMQVGINIDEIREMISQKVKVILLSTDHIKDKKDKCRVRAKKAKAAFKEDSNDINKLVLVKIHIINDNFEAAIALVNEMLSSNPENVLAQKEQMRIFLKQEKFSFVESESARRVLERRQSMKEDDKIDIDTLDFMSFLLQAYLGQNKSREAEEVAVEISRAHLKDNRRLSKILKESLSKLIDIYKQNKDNESIERLLRALYANKPSNKMALSFARFLAGQGRIEEAYDILKSLENPNHSIRGYKRILENQMQQENDKKEEIPEPRSLAIIRRDLKAKIENGQLMLEGIPAEKAKIEGTDKKKPSEVAIILAEAYMLLRRPQMAEDCIRQALRSEDIQGNAEAVKKLRQVLDFTKRRKPLFDGLIGDRFNEIHDQNKNGNGCEFDDENMVR